MGASIWALRSLLVPAVPAHIFNSTIEAGLMADAVADDGDRMEPAQVSATIKQALALMQGIATTGNEKIDAEILAAEQALRRARALLSAT